MQECTSCGAELDFRETFCSKCGEVTERGMGAGQLAGRYVTELGTGLSKLVSAAIAYAANPQNRTKIIAGAGVLALLLITFTSNPITRGIGSLFEEAPEVPRLTADGLPDLANYEDVFVGEEKELFVTGPANVRDFPTSEGTTVIRTLNEGETVKAREVKAFDPTSQWLKLAGGGYVWGANLSRDEKMVGEDGLVLPAKLRGLWSDRASCDGINPDAVVVLSKTEIDFGTSRYALTNILEAGEELPAYQLSGVGGDMLPGSKVTVSEDAKWPILWIANGDQFTGEEFRYFPRDLACTEVDAITRQMTGM